ncbi:MAG: sensor histidine kinase [Fimbriimonadaceae bacterium]|nr:sensor histidine kinase [Chitinophagales bacterium]
MKLLQRTNRTYLIVSAGLFLAAGIVMYYILLRITRNEQDEKLLVTKTRIVVQIQNNEVYPVMPPAIEVKDINSIPRVPYYFIDTTILDPVESEDEPFRELTAYERINGKNYRITVRNSRLESHDFSEIVIRSIGTMLLVLFVVMVLINRFLSKNIWKPFYENLASVKSFSLKQNKPLQLRESNIAEFNEMKTELEKLTGKIITDYNNLKSFTENASHEIQTPLSIIISKIEGLMQENNLDEQKASALEIIYRSAQRLSKLNEGLLLLTKIENDQFYKTESVDMNSIVKQQIELFSELASLKSITLYLSEKGVFILAINPQLAEILIKNLLENAIKHTAAGGNIEVIILDDRLSFTNTGEAVLKNPELLFGRFKKANEASHSLGLGLAIVRDICERNGIAIQYSFSDQKHTFTVNK